MLRDDLTTGTAAVRAPQTDSSTQVVTMPSSNDFEVDNDTQDISVSDMIIMQSSFDCEYSTAEKFSLNSNISLEVAVVWGCTVQSVQYSHDSIALDGTIPRIII